MSSEPEHPRALLLHGLSALEVHPVKQGSGQSAHTATGASPEEPVTPVPLDAAQVDTVHVPETVGSANESIHASGTVVVPVLLVNWFTIEWVVCDVLQRRFKTSLAT